MSLDNNVVLAKGSLNDIAWMAGSWEGEAFGGYAQEIWSPPLAGSMMFMFKLIVNNVVEFYEFGHVKEVDGSLLFELKHFDTALHGWEEKNEVQSFKLLKIEGNRLYFEDFTFEKISDTEINIFVLIHEEQDTVSEVKFNYKRSQ